MVYNPTHFVNHCESRLHRNPLKSVSIGKMEYIILLMEEIPHQLVDSLSHYLQGFIHPRWCRISSINSMNIDLVLNLFLYLYKRYFPWESICFSSWVGILCVRCFWRTIPLQLCMRIGKLTWVFNGNCRQHGFNILSLGFSRTPNNGTPYPYYSHTTPIRIPKDMGIVWVPLTIRGSHVLGSPG